MHNRKRAQDVRKALALKAELASSNLSEDSSHDFVIGRNSPHHGAKVESHSQGHISLGLMTVGFNEGKKTSSHRSLPSLNKITRGTAARASRADTRLSVESAGVVFQENENAPPQELLLSGGHVVLSMLGNDSVGVEMYVQAEVIIKNLRSSVDTPVVLIGPEQDNHVKNIFRKIVEKCVKMLLKT